MPDARINHANRSSIKTFWWTPTTETAPALLDGAEPDGYAPDPYSPDPYSAL